MIKQKKQFSRVLAIVMLLVMLTPLGQTVFAESQISTDAELYEKYQLYPKYEKKKKYDKYQRMKERYGFETAQSKAKAKSGYEKYRLYKKDPKKYAANVQYYDLYKKYAKYKKYVTPLDKYSKYKKYDRKEYERYKNYGGSSYKAGYERYKTFMADIDHVTTNLGPEIKVGLFSKNITEVQDEPFIISGNKEFKMTDCAGTIKIASVLIGQTVRVSYDTGGELSYKSEPSIPDYLLDVADKVCFEAVDGNAEDMLFDVNKPASDYDNYRGKIKIQHSYTSDNQDQEGDLRRIWVINMLPMEQYVWGFGEIGGGVENHSKAMLVTARTYARWYLEYATKWDEEGFDLLSTASSQIYRGYDYEKDHLSIPELAKKTNGIIMMHGSDIVLAAYGSWTDGTTRRYEDGHFGGCDTSIGGTVSIAYPELSSVSDPYGKHSSSSTCDLANAGNHMVGLSANGSLVLARDHSWSWTRILGYYYSGINIVKEY